MKKLLHVVCNGCHHPQTVSPVDPPSIYCTNCGRQLVPTRTYEVRRAVVESYQEMHISETSSERLEIKLRRRLGVDLEIGDGLPPVQFVLRRAFDVLGM